MAEQSGFFTRLIESGDFRIDDDGHATLNGQYLLMIPPPVIIHLQEELADEVGEETMEALIRDAGAYQVRQSVDRYVDRYGWEDLSREKIYDYVQDLLRVLGWGRIEIRKMAEETGTIAVSNRKPTLPAVYRDRKDEPADGPICHYLSGLLSQAFDTIFDFDVELEETQCAATGGEHCIFEQ